MAVQTEAYILTPHTSVGGFQSGKLSHCNRGLGSTILQGQTEFTLLRTVEATTELLTPQPLMLTAQSPETSEGIPRAPRSPVQRLDSIL
jgi:hypothetical protein